jgi:hypothetical protein
MHQRRNGVLNTLPPNSPPLEAPTRPPCLPAPSKLQLMCTERSDTVGGQRGDNDRSDDDDDDGWDSWQAALADACECASACGSHPTHDSDEVDDDDCTLHQAVLHTLPPPPPDAAPPLYNALLDGASQRSQRLMLWMRALPPGLVSTDGVTMAEGAHGAGVFATRDLPAGHTFLRLHSSLFIHKQQLCERLLAERYHGVGQILAAHAEAAPRPLGDGRWSTKLSRAEVMALFLICERTATLACGGGGGGGTSESDERAEGGGGGGGGLMRSRQHSGWVASLPGFATLTPPVRALQGGGSPGDEDDDDDDDDDDNGDQRMRRPPPLSNPSACEVAIQRHADSLEEFIETELRRGSLRPYFPPKVFSRAAVRWALGCVYSRVMNMGGRLQCMLPCIDMINHAATAADGWNAQVEYSEHGGEGVVQTKAAVVSGQELRICYNRLTESDTQEQLAARFGVVVAAGPSVPT